MRELSALCVLSILVLLPACGGDDSVQGPPTPPESRPVLSFGPIAGDWAGWGEDLVESGDTFWIRAELSSSAQQSSTVGTVEYGLGDTDNPPSCTGQWLASKADNPVFVVVEKIASGGCPDGTVRLELTEAGTLAYDFTPESGPFAAEGTLTRGTDPGPRPP